MIDLSQVVADPRRYGWKAHYLSLMLTWGGFGVPHAVALAASEAAHAFRDEPFADGAVAVRSSGLAEDSQDGSLAGQFESYLNVRGVQDVQKAIQSVRDSAQGLTPMAVVVQAMVSSPVISGVAFSCDPLTLDEGTVTVSWIPGDGQALVGGAAAGSDLEVDKESRAVLGEGVWPCEASLLEDLIAKIELLATRLDGPVDVEWSIGGSEPSVHILQVRPVVLPEPRVIDLLVEGFNSVPGTVMAHPKLRLRSEAAALGVPMSRARIAIGTHSKGIPDRVPFPTTGAAGRSVVLLHPPRIEGGVLREFARDCQTDVDFFVRGCQRYSIRQYPSQGDAGEAVDAVLQRGLSSGTSPMACAIEQEVLHAYATGIIKRTGDGHLVEVALGHFVPKGYVETSTFLLGDRGDVLHQHVAEQDKAYHFINGHVVTEAPPYEQLRVEVADLVRIVECVRPVLDRRPDAAIEFGVLGEPGALEPYMIDVAESDSGASALPASHIARGVVSPGIARGPVVDIRSQQTLEDLNAHLLQDVIAGREEVSRSPAIYVATRASVDLLPLVRAVPPGSGFIFERASLLAHLCVVLRERAIPAVVLTPVEIAALSVNIHLDTSSDPAARSV